MKILVNGNSINELVSESISNINICPQGREFDFKAFIQSNDKDISLSLLNKAIGHIKRNKKQYIRLVYLIAIFFNLVGVPVFASSGYHQLTMEFFEYIKIACRAIMLIGFPVEMIKCVSGGTLDQIGRISIKYIAFGLAIRFLPDIVSTLLP